VVGRNVVEEKASFYKKIKKKFTKLPHFFARPITVSSEILLWIVCMAGGFGTIFHHEILVWKERFVIIEIMWRLFVIGSKYVEEKTGFHLKKKITKLARFYQV
jgi:hypothetical protein